MDNYLEYIVREDDESARIDKFISLLDQDLSRAMVQKLIHENKVLINGQATKPSHKIRPGDLIEVTEVDLFDWEITPTPMDLVIVYEDSDVLVVDKPSGMVVHPAPGHYQDTLVNGLMYYINELSNVNGELRPGIIHRIDKDTSGLLMVAKTNRAHMILAEELKNKETRREYIALVKGVIKNKTGTIDAPIGRDKRNRLKMAVVASGKPSVTHFEVLEVYSDCTLIRCVLDTGRTHQIRVHLAYIGHPLVGDHVYGPSKANDFGQFLHARTLGFTHPISGEYMEFTSELPKEFQDKIDSLRQK